MKWALLAFVLAFAAYTVGVLALVVSLEENNTPHAALATACVVVAALGMITSFSRAGK